MRKVEHEILQLQGLGSIQNNGLQLLISVTEVFRYLVNSRLFALHTITSMENQPPWQCY